MRGQRAVKKRSESKRRPGCQVGDWRLVFAFLFYD